MKTTLQNLSLIVISILINTITYAQNCDSIATEQGVLAETLLGNPNACTLGEKPGFKIDGYYEGNFQLKNSPKTKLYYCNDNQSTLTDSNAFIRVIKTGTSEHQTFSFQASKGLIIEKVIVKGGSAKQLKSTNLNSIANIYDYTGMNTQHDAELHAPVKSDCKYFDISHIDFIFSENKNLVPSIEINHKITSNYFMENIWDIREDATEDTLHVLDGSSFIAQFQTTATLIEARSSNKIFEGYASIKNISPNSIYFDSIMPNIADANITNLSYSRPTPTTLNPGEEIICNYQAEQKGILPQTGTINYYGTGFFNAEDALANIEEGIILGTKNETIQVTRNNIYLGATSSNKIWLSSDTGMASNIPFYHSGTSTIIETDQTDSDSVLILSKTAEIFITSNTQNERFNFWSINKSVSHDTIHLNAGDSAEVFYTVSVKKDSSQLGYHTEGTVTITNPSTNTNLEGILQVQLENEEANIINTEPNGKITLTPAETKTFLFSIRNHTNLSDKMLRGTLSINGIQQSFNSAINLPSSTTEAKEYNTRIDVSDSFNNMLWKSVTEDTEWTYSRIIKGDKSYEEANDNGIIEFCVANTATIAENNKSASADIHVIQYYPQIEQNSVANFDRATSWELSVNGDSAIHEFPEYDTDINYTINVKKTSIDSNFMIEGTVTLVNPSPYEPMKLTILDTYNNENIVFNNHTPNEPILLNPGDTITLTYNYLSEEQPLSLKNHLMLQLNNQEFQNIDTSIKNDTSVNETNNTINISDNFGSITSEPITESTIINLTRTFNSPELNESDYVNGENIQEIKNQFNIVGSEPTNTTEITTTIHRYIPILTKVITTDYVKNHTWNISKTASNNELHLLAGSSKEVNYEITVEKTGTEMYYCLGGTISVKNPNPDEYLFVKLTELIDEKEIFINGVNQQGNAYIDPNTTKEFTFEVKSTEKPDNGASSTYLQTYLNETELSKPFSFEANSSVSKELNNEITVTDSYDNKIWNNIDTTSTFRYSRTINCSGIYAYQFNKGIYQFMVPNTATIVESAQSAQANVKVWCYAPIISQSIAATYTDKINWTVEKTSDASEITISEGETTTIPFEVKVDAQSTNGDYLLNGTITLFNPHPNDSMQINIANYYRGQAINLTSPILNLPPLASDSINYCQTMESAQSGFSDIQARLNNTVFYNMAYVIFQHSNSTSNSEIKIEDSMLDYSLGTVSSDDNLPAYFNYNIQLKPEYNNNIPETVSNTVTLVGTNEIIETSSTCNVTILVKQAESPEQSDSTASGSGCTLTPGYWKTHSLNSGKYDIKWTNLPDIDADGVNEFENEMFYQSNYTYHEIISTSSNSSCYIILARSFGAAYLNILSGADKFDVATEFILAQELLKAYTIESAESERTTFIQLANILDKFNNGIIGPGHCSDSNRNSTSTIQSKNDTLTTNSSISIFPNPSLYETNFNFTIAENSSIKIEIYNSMGNLITVLFNEQIETNEERNIQVPFIKELGKVYFYRIIINNTIENGILLPQ